jgi:hypothetical protein
VTPHPGGAYNREVADQPPSSGLKKGPQVTRIIVRNEFGPLLQAAMPECEIDVRRGETHLTARVRDQAELFGLLDRLRNLGAEITSFTLDD